MEKENLENAPEVKAMKAEIVKLLGAMPLKEAKELIARLSATEEKPGVASIKELTPLLTVVVLNRLKKMKEEGTLDSLLKKEPIQKPVLEKEVEELAEKESDNGIEEHKELVTRNEVMPVPVGSPQGILAIGRPEDIDKMMVFLDKIKQITIQVLKQLPARYFVKFGTSICLLGKGIDKFISGMPLPVDIVETKEMPKEFTPNGYPVAKFQAKAVNKITGMGIPIYAEISSEKPFWSTRWIAGKKTKLKPEDINFRDVRMACHRELRKEMVKAFFGLRGLDEQDAREIGLNPDKIYKVPMKE